MERTFVSVYFVPNNKEERFQFKNLKNVFPFISNAKVKSKIFFSESQDELKYIPLETDKCLTCVVVGQKIILEDGREFIRKVNIRYDDTKHGETRTHLNIYLWTIYPKANKTKEHKLKMTHMLNIKNRGIQTLHVLLSTPGSSISRSVVVLPTLQDKKYHQKQNYFLDKLKSKKLTKKDELKFRKEFKAYSNYISGMFD